MANAQVKCTTYSPIPFLFSCHTIIHCAKMLCERLGFLVFVCEGAIVHTASNVHAIPPTGIKFQAHREGRGGSQVIDGAETATEDGTGDVAAINC